MSLKSINNKGLGAIEGLLTIIALALIVFVGFYIYHANKNTNDTYNQATKISQSQPARKAGSSVATVKPTEANLQTYLLKTCSSKDSSAIKALFSNQTAQNVGTNNIKINGNYAIANVNCTLSDGSELTTLVVKFSSNKWNLVVKTATSVTCDFLTQQGFPDNLKAPYCQNGQLD